MGLQNRPCSPKPNTFVGKDCCGTMMANINRLHLHTLQMAMQMLRTVRMQAGREGEPALALLVPGRVSPSLATQGLPLELDGPHGVRGVAGSPAPRTDSLRLSFALHQQSPGSPRAAHLLGSLGACILSGSLRIYADGVPSLQPPHPTPPEIRKSQ